MATEKIDWDTLTKLYWVFYNASDKKAQEITNNSFYSKEDKFICFEAGLTALDKARGIPSDDYHSEPIENDCS